jgi:replication factor C large subunit
MLVGNEESVATFKDWLKSWTVKRKPKKKACLLVGPPGAGKTTLARAAANDLEFRIIEMNASDVRTEKAIKHLLAPASASLTLDSFSGENRGNLILMDEVDGIFGREDRGGLGAILKIISQTPIPIVLTANDIANERFDDLKKSCLLVELFEIRPRVLVSLLEHILRVEGQDVSVETVKEIAKASHGDIRSAINDLQAMATSGTSRISSFRTRELDEQETLKGLFSSPEFSLARRVLNETEIPLYRDELLLLLHDLLPYLYTSRSKLAQAFDGLSRADMAYGRVGASRSRGMMPPPFNLPRRDAVPQWTLLPVALNELASVGVLRVDNDVEHAIEVAPLISRKVVDRYQYRLWSIDHLCTGVAKACHASKRKSLREIIPFLEAIFRVDQEKGRQVALSLGLDERDIQFLLSESKVAVAPSGPEQLLDPNGFKLPYMGRDKFIQLMRIGLTYDRNRGMFVVRSLSNLGSIEERLGDVVGKPVRFERPEQASVEGRGVILKDCYVDGRQVSCSKCEFVGDCRTHTMATLKFCLCDETLLDQEGYDKYVAKNQPAKKAVKVVKPAKRKSSRKKN